MNGSNATDYLDQWINGSNYLKWMDQWIQWIVDWFNRQNGYLAGCDTKLEGIQKMASFTSCPTNSESLKFGPCLIAC
jgi:hypothetical protein